MFLLLWQELFDHELEAYGVRAIKWKNFKMCEKLAQSKIICQLIFLF